MTVSKYEYIQLNLYLYKSIRTIIFIFIHEYTYKDMSMYTSVYVPIYVFESYKRVFIRM